MRFVIVWEGFLEVGRRGAENGDKAHCNAGSRAFQAIGGQEHFFEKNQIFLKKRISPAVGGGS